jgi:hypothetical protein
MVKFEMGKRTKTLGDGSTQDVPCEMIRIPHQGTGKDCLVRPATDADRAKHPDAYAEFKAPIITSPVITPVKKSVVASVVAALKPTKKER